MSNSIVIATMGSLCNLLCNMQPSDGPMVKDILNVSLEGLLAFDNGIALESYDAMTFLFLHSVKKALNCGRYDILPTNRSDNDYTKYNAVPVKPMSMQDLQLVVNVADIMEEKIEAAPHIKLDDLRDWDD